MSDINGDHRKHGAKHAMHRVLQVKILRGKHNCDSELTFIPCIALIPSCQPGFNFHLCQCQFPIHLAFLLTICLTHWTQLTRTSFPMDNSMLPFPVPHHVRGWKFSSPLPLKNVGFTMSCTAKHSLPCNPLPPLLPIHYNCWMKVAKAISAIKLGTSDSATSQESEEHATTFDMVTDDNHIFGDITRVCHSLPHLTKFLHLVTVHWCHIWQHLASTLNQFLWCDIKFQP